MAKKRRREGGASGRAGVASGRGGPPPDLPAVRPAPARPGGPNRLARKEEARRERERLRRKMARRRWYRVGAAVLALAAVAAGVTGYLVTRPNPAAAAGCTAVRTTPDYRGGQDRVHIGSQGGPAKAPPLSSYPTTPPASGPHAPTTLPAGVYDTPPPIDMAIHSLEHGAVIIWYRPTVPPSRLRAITAFVDRDRDHLILAPYDYAEEGRAGELPAGTDLALVAWHRLQTCREVSLGVVEQFTARFRSRTGVANPNSPAPEAGTPI